MSFQTPEQRAEMLAALVPEEHAPSEQPTEAPADVNYNGNEEGVGSETSAAPVTDQDHGQEDRSSDNGLIPRHRYNEAAKERDELRAKLAELEKQQSDRQEPEPEPTIEDFLKELYEDPEQATVDPEVLDLLMKTKRDVDRIRQEKEDAEVQRWVNQWNEEIAAEKSRIAEETGVDVPESWFWERIQLSRGMRDVADIANDFKSVLAKQAGPPTTPRPSGGRASGSVTSANTPTEKPDIRSVSDATAALRRAMGV